MNKLKFTNKNIDNLNKCITENGKVELIKFIKLTNNLYEDINYTSCCTDFKTNKEKDAFDKGYSKGWEVGISVK
jgi:hypothetical protein